MKWKILNTGSADPEVNMAIDYELLQGLVSTKQPILHLYDWNCNCATFGHFIDPFKFVKKEVMSRYQIKLARRPTGGGVLFHLTDFAFSILVPASHPAYSLNTLENYAFVNGIIASMIHQFMGNRKFPELLQMEQQNSDPHSKHFCMAKPTKYDVVYQGKKVGGAAQRRTKAGFLHQGTISIALPKEELLDQVLMSPSVLVAMKENSFTFLQETWTKKDLAEMRLAFQDLLINAVR